MHDDATPKQMHDNVQEWRMQTTPNCRKTEGCSAMHYPKGGRAGGRAGARHDDRTRERRLTWAEQGMITDWCCILRWRQSRKLLKHLTMRTNQPWW